ncbi:MAG: MltA domain-containing protein [Alphaproteobacteria bacterium GM7ARS4]|nr:MltA domain-containing protein [Alphaproteobacteria bacterium GM7ARS4]
MAHCSLCRDVSSLLYGWWHAYGGVWRAFVFLGVLGAVSLVVVVVWRGDMLRDDVPVAGQGAGLVTETDFASIGAPWRESVSHLDGAFEAFRRSCQRWQAMGWDEDVMFARLDRHDSYPPQSLKASSWRSLCALSETLDRGTADSLRLFFEEHFTPYDVWMDGQREGLFTGYYRVVLFGSTQRDERFSVPLYGAPSDMVFIETKDFPQCGACPSRLIGRLHEGRITAYPTRGAIMAGTPIDAPVLVWLDDAFDAFLLSVQGSGKVILRDGRVMVLGYHRQNGHPYRPIAKSMRDEGVIDGDTRMTLSLLRLWFATKTEAERKAILALNPSYVFFTLIETPEAVASPIGAFGVPLVAGHSLAVDTRYIPLGVPLWVETTHPFAGHEGERPWHRLMVAHDRGGAIRGSVRGDIYWGEGHHAERLAGATNWAGHYRIFLPKNTSTADTILHDDTTQRP